MNLGMLADAVLEFIITYDTWFAMGIEIAIGSAIGVKIYLWQSNLKNKRVKFETNRTKEIFSSLAFSLGKIYVECDSAYPIKSSIPDSAAIQKAIKAIKICMSDMTDIINNSRDVLDTEHIYTLRAINTEAGETIDIIEKKDYQAFKKNREEIIMQLNKFMQELGEDEIRQLSTKASKRSK